MKKFNFTVDFEIWNLFAKYSCRLNVDEAGDIDKVWEEISKLINIDTERIKTSIQPLRDLFIVLDHTRTVMIVIQDGSLPSNVGGGSNLRNLLRRTFAIL